MYKTKIPYLNLYKIYNSGQCFSWTMLENGIYLIVDGSHHVVVKDIGESKYEFSCAEKEFKDYWWNYFDLDRDYEEIFSHAIWVNDELNNDFYNNAIRYGDGIRVLNQDPWQTIITFMISQNNNMKRIRKSVDMLKKKYGKQIPNIANQCYFPTDIQLADACFEECGCGYRSEYLRELCQFFYEYDDGNFITDWKNMCTDDLLKSLTSIKGIGEKVANCIALYGFNRTECAPIDTHMKQIINDKFNGVNILREYFNPNVRGIIQQYLFDYKTKEQ